MAENETAEKTVDESGDGRLRSIAAFDELIDAVVAARDGYVLAEERRHDRTEVLEGLRYVLQLVSEVDELIVEGDPERPRFSSIVSPARKFLGDNPDALYQQALIRGDRSYRITGRMREQDYISFTVHAPAPDGGMAGAVQNDINDRDLTVADDGTFELVLAAAGSGIDGVELRPDAHIVLVRNYYQRELSAHNDPAIAVELSIEPLDDPGPAPLADDEALADRLRAAAAFLRSATEGLRIFHEPGTAPFVSNEPNSVGPPWSFRSADIDTPGAVDVYYSSGRFALEPGEAMVMDAVIPPGPFTNVMLWNVHMQTLDYVTRRSSLNAAQMETDDEGRCRIVISAEDPGVPNWLDTGGHRRGTIFWRFLLPETEPAQPVCSVVPVGTLRA
jgi:hypothetical protein